jgi:hypothetical protein
LLAVELPAGTHDVNLRFLPVSAVGGALVSLTAIGLALWFVRKRLAWRLMVPASLLCGLPALIAMQALGEPAFEQPAALAPDGKPLAVAQPSADVEPAHARFEGDVSLVGSRITPNIDENTVTFELDFRSGARPNPALGVFVHIEPSQGDRFGADHALLSESMSFADMPPNTLVRDLFTVVVAPEQRTRSWTVWAGLWALRGDGARMKVLEPGGREVHADRIRIGRIDRDVGVPDAGQGDGG